MVTINNLACAQREKSKYIIGWRLKVGNLGRFQGIRKKSFK